MEETGSVRVVTGRVRQATTKLAAGGLDGLALGLANRLAHTPVAQYGHKPADCLRLRPLEGKARHGIVRDQVDMPCALEGCARA